MNKPKEKDHLPSEAQIAEYEIVVPFLRATYNEISDLSKKKQDGVLNKLKVDMINRILKRTKTALSEESGIEFLELLDDITLPSNSDAALILRTFLAATEKFQDKYIRWDKKLSGKRWFSKENP